MTAERIARAIGELPMRVKVVAIALCCAAIAAAAAAGLITHPARGTLFAAPLRADELAEVQEQLAQWNVPFSPTQDNVVVDLSHRNDILLRLSLAGVPHEHLEGTNEALSSIGALTPQTVVDAATRSGLEGDIAMSLRGIAGIDDARVILAVAKPAEFADETSQGASASVRLVLRSGTTLSDGVVAGIRAFVAASVAGLDASHVVILDDHGAALGDRATGTGDDGQALQRGLQSALDVALGAGASIVRVHVEYGRAEREERDLRRTPLGGAPIERAAQSESYVDAAKHYAKNDVRDDRGSETREVVTHADPGAIARIATAVVVDARRIGDLASVRAIAQAAVGFDARRGDTLDVQAVPFAREPEVRRDGWFLAYGAIVPSLPTLIVVIGMLIAARWCWPYVVPCFEGLVERLSARATVRVVAGYEPARVRGVLEREPPHAAAAIISALPAATAAAVLELYPPHEREAIVARMQRAHSRVVPSVDEVLSRHA